MGYWILWDIEPRVGTDLGTSTDVSEGSDPLSTEETRRSVLEDLLDGLDVSVKKVQPEHNPADQFSKATDSDAGDQDQAPQRAWFWWTATGHEGLWLLLRP